MAEASRMYVHNKNSKHAQSKSKTKKVHKKKATLTAAVLFFLSCSQHTSARTQAASIPPPRRTRGAILVNNDTFLPPPPHTHTHSLSLLPFVLSYANTHTDSTNGVKSHPLPLPLSSPHTTNITTANIRQPAVYYLPLSATCVRSCSPPAPMLFILVKSQHKVGGLLCVWRGGGVTRDVALQDWIFPPPSNNHPFPPPPLLLHVPPLLPLCHDRFGVSPSPPQSTSFSRASPNLFKQKKKRNNKKLSEHLVLLAITHTHMQSGTRGKWGAKGETGGEGEKTNEQK